jgi:hypothetical protein
VPVIFVPLFIDSAPELCSARFLSGNRVSKGVPPDVDLTSETWYLKPA